MEIKRADITLALELKEHKKYTDLINMLRSSPRKATDVITTQHVQGVVVLAFLIRINHHEKHCFTTCG